MGRPKGIHNSSNRGPGQNINARSGFKGVYFCKGKYMSTLQYKGVSYYLGRFETAEEASKAYKEKEMELWGERAAPCERCGGTWKTKRVRLCDECKEKRRLQNQIWLSTPEQKFETLKRGANKRKIQCELTFEEYKNLSEGKSCFYCDGKIGKQPTHGHGLDRLDNNKGYIIDNVVPCCWDCNALKQDMLTPEETKAAVEAIIKIRLNNLIKDSDV